MAGPLVLGQLGCSLAVLTNTCDQFRLGTRSRQLRVLEFRTELVGGHVFDSLRAVASRSAVTTACVISVVPHVIATLCLSSTMSFDLTKDAGTAHLLEPLDLLIGGRCRVDTLVLVGLHVALEIIREFAKEVDCVPSIHNYTS